LPAISRGEPQADNGHYTRSGSSARRINEKSPAVASGALHQHW